MALQLATSPRNADLVSPANNKISYYDTPVDTELNYPQHAEDTRTSCQKLVNSLTFGLAYPRTKPISPGDSIPIGMTLFIRQKGYHDISDTLLWRFFWLLCFSALFFAQWMSYENGMIPFRLPFWYLILAMAYFTLGVLHVTLKSLDDSGLTALLQTVYVVAYSFTMGTSVFYIFILFMDDVNRSNPRRDHLYVVLSDGWVGYTYLRTRDLSDPECITEFSHDRNISRYIENKQRYGFFWFYHIACHIILPLVLAVPLYVENTRIYYKDCIISIGFTVFYSIWLFIGSRYIYNRRKNTPCVGSSELYCQSDKINPEYRTIYSKLNYFQGGETTAYLLLMYLCVFISFYCARAISKRHARSASSIYAQPEIKPATAPAIDFSKFNQVPSEKSQQISVVKDNVGGDNKASPRDINKDPSSAERPRTLPPQPSP